MTFDIAEHFRDDLPEAPGQWQSSPEFSFVGGHNDPANIPFSGLSEALVNVLRREGQNLAFYNLGGSPLGYEPLREFVISQLGARAGMTGGPDQVLMVSGSLQALDLVNEAMLSAGDTVLIEQATYGGMLSRLNRLGVTYVGIELDDGGIDLGHLRSMLEDLASQGVSPKYLYTIPTVQNPTGSVMPLERRRALLDLAREYSLPIFEDECYADLTWGCERPPSLRALDGDGGQVIYCGSFSKSVAPSLRLGYVIADDHVIRQLLALKTDAGTGSLEQLALAEYCPSNFESHVERLTDALKTKSDAMVDAVRSEFGPDVTVEAPMGGIYVWLTFPEGTDTASFSSAAASAGIEFNPGAEWSTDPGWGKRRLRLCFGAHSVEDIRAGVAALATVYGEHLGGS
ncbi:MAG: PLP-dependent aminotransferase family protein [Acidimicrobiales bacterium]|nr:PLP-dependent aminotransferase family protein [Acidimicrobiales bacterium]RZV48131.1 MAG: PLP-dependent aminotransferase family protein [Acidimicrobiales bacterium]